MGLRSSALGMMLVVLAQCLGLGAVSCGGGASCGAQASCIANDGSGCIDYSSSAAAKGQVEQTCAHGGINSTSLCSKANVVGGCVVVGTSGCATAWYYTGNGVTEAGVQQACSRQQGSFVRP